MMLLGEAVEETIRRLSEVPGTGTQVYTEPRVVRLINSAFKFLRSHADWPELMQWYTKTLDGSTGKITVPLSNVVGPKDLRAVMPVNSDRKLAIMPSNVNMNKLEGTNPRFVQMLGPVDDPYVLIDNVKTKKLFRVWPLTSTGNLNILVKHNRNWTDQDAGEELWLDDEALILHACMIEVSSDGANQAEQAKFQEQFRDRLKQITGENFILPVEVNPSSVTTPLTWFDPAEYM